MSASPVRSPLSKSPLLAGSEDDPASASTGPKPDASHDEQPAAKHQVGSEQAEQIAPGVTPIEPEISISATMSTNPEDNMFHSAPTDEAKRAEGDDSYQEAGAESLLPPPDFKPFFTLIEDTETGEHHHPTVHYIFSDDDPDLLTSTALQVIDHQATDGSQVSPSEIEDRIVILDVAADGKTVACASSLSPKWQTIKATTRQAPSWGGDANEAEAGLMLSITGEESKRGNVASERRMRSSNLEDMVKAFGEKLQGLDEVLGRDEHDNDNTVDRVIDEQGGNL